MYNISKNPAYEEYTGMGSGRNLYKFQITNVNYNNEIYHIEAVFYATCSFCMNEDGSLFISDNDDELNKAKEYVSIVNQLFNFKGWPYGELWPTTIYNVSFSIKEEDIVIKDNLLYIPIDKIFNFKATVIDKKVYSYKDYTCDSIDELMDSGDKTNILLSHEKGEEIYKELFFGVESTCELDPDFNNGDFLYFDHGFEFEKI